MKKKLLLLLVICLAAAALTTGAAADGDAQGSNVQYGSINNDQISWSYDSDSHFLTIECNVETGTSTTLNRDMVRNIVDAISASEKKPCSWTGWKLTAFTELRMRLFSVLLE